ncbi:acyl-CoA thioesterase [Streptomyces sp. NBC_00385]|uniref:acyl-CoA thioesterase n=1 Tax=Streptomyces sp. NBC_00385 TaxID=2975733 RepID=UPI002DD7C90E|nr:acyl-CoA thioesterase domain-containing protein [Streptomyces sp. NBC_00385]WRZ01937.1 thioesterase family protein [Streptomyces sp. NBC_00385]
MTDDKLSDLVGCLELKPLETGSYLGRSQRLAYRRVYGGQLLAQFARAASLAAGGRALKSLHTQFLREGSTGEPVRYDTDVLRSGRTFSAVRLTAWQEHGIVAVADACLHEWEEGPDRQSVEAVGEPPGPERTVDLTLLPWESRAADDLDTVESGPPVHELWSRMPDAGESLAAPMVAYTSDLTLIGTALRPVHGMTQDDSGRAFTSAVTSHTLWFHRRITGGDWLLLRQHSPLAAHGRCFGRGDVLNRDGVLLASYAQEALLRFA